MLDLPRRELFQVRRAKGFSSEQKANGCFFKIGKLRAMEIVFSFFDKMVEG